MRNEVVVVSKLERSSHRAQIVKGVFKVGTEGMTGERCPRQFTTLLDDVVATAQNSPIGSEPPENENCGGVKLEWRPVNKADYK